MTFTWTLQVLVMDKWWRFSCWARTMLRLWRSLGDIYLIHFKHRYHGQCAKKIGPIALIQMEKSLTSPKNSFSISRKWIRTITIPQNLSRAPNITSSANNNLLSVKLAEKCKRTLISYFLFPAKKCYKKRVT